MKKINPQWIIEFIEDALDLWMAEGESINDVYVDGSFSPKELAEFLDKKMEEK